MNRTRAESGLSAETARLIVAGDASRWLPAIRRFAPQWLPQSLTAAVDECEAKQVASRTAGLTAGAVFWAVRLDTLVATCEHVAAIRVAAPTMLQLAAVRDLSPPDVAALSEFGIAATVSNPEELPRLRPMVHGYFAARFGILD